VNLLLTFLTTLTFPFPWNPPCDPWFSFFPFFVRGDFYLPSRRHPMLPSSCSFFYMFPPTLFFFAPLHSTSASCFPSLPPCFKFNYMPAALITFLRPSALSQQPGPSFTFFAFPPTKSDIRQPLSLPPYYLYFECDGLPSLLLVQLLVGSFTLPYLLIYTLVVEFFLLLLSPF